MKWSMSTSIIACISSVGDQVMAQHNPDEKRFQDEWTQIKRQYQSLLNAEYLLKEIQLCESFLQEKPNLTLPRLLVNSARSMLLTGVKNGDKHRLLPLFLGWSELDVLQAMLSGQPIPDSVTVEYQRYLSYSNNLKKHGAELVAAIA